MSEAYAFAASCLPLGTFAAGSVLPPYSLPVHGCEPGVPGHLQPHTDQDEAGCVKERRSLKGLASKQRFAAV